MKMKHRCANCGYVLNKPENLCKMCGYQRKALSKPEHVFSVRLATMGNNPDKIRSIIIREGISPAELSMIEASLPKVILQTTERQQAERMTAALVKGGASAEYRDEKPRLDLSLQSVESHENQIHTLPENSEKERGFKAWTVIVFLLIMISNYLPELVEYKDIILEKYESIVSTQSGFSQVSIVVAAKSIKQGQVITLSDLKLKKISRENAPDNAVAPLHVNMIVGQKAVQDFDTDDHVFLDSPKLEGVTDHE